MTSMNEKILRVPGARLSYEVHGSGPLLLLIHAGAGNGRSFTGLVDQLVDSYTVLTYDRRGLSRSPLDDATEEQRVEMQSDDASQLLTHIGTVPALVFGSSAGAVIGLDLATRYPEEVRTLVAHEPPVANRYLVPGEDCPDDHADIQEIYHREGATAAFRQLVKGVRAKGFEDREPGVQIPEQSKGDLSNLAFFFQQELGMVSRYQFDFAALKASSARMVIAGGQVGQEYVGYRGAVAVAERLGVAIVEFPGDHAGYLTHPRAFAEKLRQVLDREEERC